MCGRDPQPVVQVAPRVMPSIVRDQGCLLQVVWLIALLGFFGFAIAGEQLGVELPAGALLVESYQWHDADTPIDVRLRLPYGVILDEPRGIRAVDYDAWELGSRGGADVTAEERAKGRLAFEQIRQLSVGRSLYVLPVGRGSRDSFGRLLGRLYLVRPGEVIDLAQWARAHGHVRPKAKE